MFILKDVMFYFILIGVCCPARGQIKTSQRIRGLVCYVNANQYMILGRMMLKIVFPLYVERKSRQL